MFFRSSKINVRTVKTWVFWDSLQHKRKAYNIFLSISLYIYITKYLTKRTSKMAADNLSI